VAEFLTGFDSALEDASGDSDDGRVGWAGVDDNRVCAEARACSDGDVAENFRAGADDNSIFDRRVAFRRFKTGSTEADTLVNDDVVSDDGRLTDDDAHAVIDDEASTNLSARMNFDTRDESTHLAKESWEERNPALQQKASDPIKEHRLDSWIEEQDLEHASGCWIVTAIISKGVQRHLCDSLGVLRLHVRLEPRDDVVALKHRFAIDDQARNLIVVHELHQGIEGMGFHVDVVKSDLGFDPGLLDKGSNFGTVGTFFKMVEF
jgi:hypothetical protein